jgi:hypothetical protein
LVSKASMPPYVTDRAKIREFGVLYARTVTTSR